MEKTHIAYIYATIRKSATADHATAPCCLSHGGLSGRSLRPFACCPPQLFLSAVENVKSALCGL